MLPDFLERYVLFISLRSHFTRWLLTVCLVVVCHQVASGQQEGERLAMAGLQPGLSITTPFITGAHLPSYLAASALEREGGSAHNPLLQHMALLEQSQNPLVSGMCFTMRLELYLR